MAKLKNTNWIVRKHTGDNEDSLDGIAYRIVRYAMRTDGVVLKQVIVGFPNLFDDGNVRRHNYGWKIASRKPRKDIYEYLLDRGYSPE